MTWSRLRLVMPTVSWMSPAQTTPGPLAVSVRRLGVSTSIFSVTPLRLRTMSVTSSSTPGTLLNSCRTLSICTLVMAAPCSDDIRMRRSALPSVRPKPRSSGSATTEAVRPGSTPGLTPSCVGRISADQFFWIMRVLHSSSLPDPAEGNTRGKSEKPRTARRRRGPGSCHGQASDAATLGRTAAVMGDRRHVANRGDVEADGGQRAQRRFAPRAGALHLDLQGAHAVFLRLAAGILGGQLGGIGGRFARPLEAHGAGGRPRDGVALHVRDQDLGVVERGVHMRHASGDVLALLALDTGLVASHWSCPPL